MQFYVMQIIFLLIAFWLVNIFKHQLRTNVKIPVHLYILCTTCMCVISYALLIRIILGCKKPFRGSVIWECDVFFFHRIRSTLNPKSRLFALSGSSSSSESFPEVRRWCACVCCCKTSTTTTLRWHATFLRLVVASFTGSCSQKIRIFICGVHHMLLLFNIC